MSHWCGCEILLSGWSKELGARMQSTMSTTGQAPKEE